MMATGEPSPVTARVPQHRERLDVLQAYRGLAALAVVLFHAGVGAAWFWHADFMGGAARVGRLGVDFFFVLSGFIICHVHLDEIGHPSYASRYLFKRWCRIYPPLFVALLIKTAHLFIGFGVRNGGKLNADVILNSYLLLPTDVRILDVAWSLSHEMLFYLVFLIALLSGRTLALLIGATWFTLILALNTQATLVTDPLPHFVFSPYNAQFLLGCVAALGFRMKVRPIAGWLALAAGAGLLAFGWFAYDALRAGSEAFRCYYWGVAFFLVTWGTLLVGRQVPIKVPRALMHLGDASYSIYLVHNSIQFLLMALAVRLIGVPAHVQPALWLVVVISLAGGLMYYRWVEKPMLNQTNAWIARRFPVRGALSGTG